MNTTEPVQDSIAKINGEPYLTLPKDLYIPPHALEVILEAFEGPLDLLLYLIKKQNLDVLNIPIAEITQQYIDYINLMQGLRLELVAEYLVMAATLAEIKSRMLLPRPASLSPEEEDPRAELVRRLQEYERIKNAAQQLDALPQQGRDVFLVEVDPPTFTVEKPPLQVELHELLSAFKEVMKRAKMFSHHHVKRESLSIRERMSHILESVSKTEFTEFTNFFDVKEGRMGVVVTFIAILELLRQSLIEIVQADIYSPIHIKSMST